jgi:hypothetical protein
MSETVQRSVPCARYCKRGHLRTSESTFERKVKRGDKIYLVRECRVCHSIRETYRKRKSWGGKNSTSKWMRWQEQNA